MSPPPFIVARLSASLITSKQVLVMPYRIAKSCFDVKRSI